MRIFLVGYMGCGKSKWGELIAKHYNLDFIDLDRTIEKREKMTISEIFNQVQEKGFRKKEQEALHAIQNKNQVVVATGGGTPCFKDNMQKMNELGESIYIEAIPEILYHRLINQSKERPLLKNIPAENLMKHIENQLNERSFFYQQAKHKMRQKKNLMLSHFTQILDPFML